MVGPCVFDSSVGGGGGLGGDVPESLSQESFAKELHLQAGLGFGVPSTRPALSILVLAGMDVYIMYRYVCIHISEQG